jgi:hypothetical protein
VVRPLNQCRTEIFPLLGELRRGPGVRVVAVAERRDIDEVSRRGIFPDLGVDDLPCAPHADGRDRPPGGASAWLWRMAPTIKRPKGSLRGCWSWPLPVVIMIAIGFATMDGGFLSANIMKVAQGGWVPLMLGALICCVMLVWQKGTATVLKLVDEIPIGDIAAQIASGNVPRVPGTAVFLARLTGDFPPIVVWYLRHIRSLHDSIVIANVVPRWSLS